jgi:hypothetical protein
MPFDQKSSARDGESSGRPTNTEDTVRAEPTINELIEARERADAGVRLAMPKLAEQLDLGGGQAEADPAAAEEAAQRTGPDLLDVRAALIVAAARFPLSDEALHKAFNDAVNRVDGIGAMLAERHAR